MALKKLVLTKELKQKLKDLKHAMLDKHGREIVDSDQVEIPSGLSKPQTLQERMARVLRQEFSMQAYNAGHETFEEANDFDTGEGVEPEDLSTNYTLMEDDLIEAETADNPVENDINTDPSGAIETPTGEPATADNDPSTIPPAE